jgi:hypothetical protein
MFPALDTGALFETYKQFCENVQLSMCLQRKVDTRLFIRYEFSSYWLVQLSTRLSKCPNEKRIHTKHDFPVPSIGWHNSEQGEEEPRTEENSQHNSSLLFLLDDTQFCGNKKPHTERNSPKNSLLLVVLIRSEILFCIAIGESRPGFYRVWLKLGFKDFITHF